MTWGFDTWRWGSKDTLRSLFELGLRWQSGSKDEIAVVRRDLLKLSDCDFVEIVKLLTEADNCAREVLKELGRTPAFRRRMKEVGFLPPTDDEPRRRHEWYRDHRPSRSHEVLKKFGIELPKPKPPPSPAGPPPPPRPTQIGPSRHRAVRIRLTREELYERVWSTPVHKLAAEWGLSDRGLAKACKRLRVPVPPRGYWARMRAGQKPRKAKLPKVEGPRGHQ